MTTNKLLSDTGKALYGPLWQSQLARDLHVSDRTVRRWLAGDAAMPAGVMLELSRLAMDRALALEALLDNAKLREEGRANDPRPD